MHVSGTVVADLAAGTFVEPDGARISWAARPAYRPPYDSGALFSVIDDACRTGVIVSQRTSYDGAASVQGVWCSTVNGTTTYLPVTVLDTPGANASHLRVQVDARSGALVLDVPRVSSAE